MSCPLNKNKFIGSGYRKSDTTEKQCSELDTKMAKMLEERMNQDKVLFPLNNPESNELLNAGDVNLVKEKQEKQEKQKQVNTIVLLQKK